MKRLKGTVALRFVIAHTLFFAFVSFSLFGADINWDGGGDGVNWDVPANWVGDAIPAEMDKAIIDGGAFSVNIRTSEGVSHVEVLNGATLNILQNASLTIISSMDDESMRIATASSVSNYGSLSISNVNYGIYVREMSTRFDNYGIIVITGVGTTANDCIRIENDNPTFVNHDGASITVNLSSQSAHELMDINGSFTNNGEIILNCGSSNHTGSVVEIRSNASDPSVLTNNGIIEINVTLLVQNDIIVFFGSINPPTLINTGLFTIDGTVGATHGAIKASIESQIVNGGTCGIFNILSQNLIINDGTSALITNSGTIATTYTGPHENLGTFTNNGIIQTPNGTFSLTGGSNALVGSGSVISGPVPAELTPSCPGYFTSIPTLGEWGLLILGLFLAIFGVGTVRQSLTQAA